MATRKVNTAKKDEAANIQDQENNTPVVEEVKEHPYRDLAKQFGHTVKESAKKHKKALIIGAGSLALGTLGVLGLKKKAANREAVNVDADDYGNDYCDPEPVGESEAPTEE